VSRWPVAGPSEYWLLASSPASKEQKKQQSTHSTTNTHKMTTIHIRLTELPRPHQNTTVYSHHTDRATPAPPEHNSIQSLNWQSYPGPTRTPQYTVTVLTELLRPHQNTTVYSHYTDRATPAPLEHHSLQSIYWQSYPFPTRTPQYTVTILTELPLPHQNTTVYSHYTDRPTPSPPEHHSIQSLYWQS